jgi:hypothetical protein
MNEERSKKVSAGYGSEWHMLRMLGRHRHELNRAVQTELATAGVNDVQRICWLDFPYDAKSPSLDGEWKGLDFLPDLGGPAWPAYWPDKKPGKLNRDGIQSWDAVARMERSGGAVEWIVVEAKAHEDEFINPRAACGAGGVSLKKIKAALQETFEALKMPDAPAWSEVEGAWMGKYYQMANRLACLHFLVNKAKAPARLLYVGFTCDSYRKCPTNAKGWHGLVAKANAEMGITVPNALSDRIHFVCPDVRGAKIRG